MSATSLSPRLLQLYSLRAQVDALIASEEEATFGANTGCPHPSDKRIPASNMGEEPSFFCQDCKQMVKGTA